MATDPVEARPTTTEGGSCGCDHLEPPVSAVATSSELSVSVRGYVSVDDALRGLRGREAAKVRRQLLCVQGRGDLAACRPTGRMRRRDTVAPKVEEGTTLAGTRVTGTQVELTATMTGADAGSCRVISGTQYVGIEQFEERCDEVPEAPPAKVSVGRTAAGRRVSGTSLAPSPSVTGSEAGACRRVTGVDYLEANAVEEACGVVPEPAPAKVTVGETVQGQRVTGVVVDRPAAVTGDDVGRRQRVTGSQYQHPEWIRGESRNGSSVPHKVSVMSTVRGRPVTGTIVTPDPTITGADRGACVEVTGTEYEDSLAKYQACNRQPAPGPHKVSVMRTWRGEVVTGTSVEHDPRVTGDEAGQCEDVTGTPYVGPGQYEAVCATDPVRQGAPGGSSIAISGTRVSGSDRVTGDERGRSVTVSGTPYQRGPSGDAERGVSAWGRRSASPRQHVLRVNGRGRASPAPATSAVRLGSRGHSTSPSVLSRVRQSFAITPARTPNSRCPLARRPSRERGARRALPSPAMPGIVRPPSPGQKGPPHGAIRRCGEPLVGASRWPEAPTSGQRQLASSPPAPASPAAPVA